jgi:hypothetical protein
MSEDTLQILVELRDECLSAYNHDAAMGNLTSYSHGKLVGVEEAIRAIRCHESGLKLLTYTEAGEIANVSHTTIGAWVKAGRLKAAPMPTSGAKRIKQSTLRAFLISLPEV